MADVIQSDPYSLDDINALLLPTQQQSIPVSRSPYFFPSESAPLSGSMLHDYSEMERSINILNNGASIR